MSMVQCGWPHGIPLPRSRHLCVPIPPSQLLLGLLLLPRFQSCASSPIGDGKELSPLLFVPVSFHNSFSVIFMGFEERTGRHVRTLYQNPYLLLFSGSLSTMACSIKSQVLRLNRGQLGRTTDRLWYFIRYIIYASLLAKTEGRREGRRKNGNSFPMIIF